MTEFASVVTKGPQTVLPEYPERALLVGIDRPENVFSLEESLGELERLVDTAGACTVARTSQKLISPNPRTFVGSGKAEEIASLCQSLNCDLVVFDDELTPSQQSNLEKVVPKSVKVIDRTALILDIFALHATSKEGRLQVRLAQNLYLLPRLRGMWAHLASNRMGGGVGSRFGEGESQLEVDRRLVRKRITTIRRELAEVAANRATQRKNRLESSLFRIALAGYTNAGKSSLLNALTSAEVLSYDKLFATLDSTTRKFSLPEGREVTLTDTVGFIQKLPTKLVEAFKSTLDEISQAQLIVHVVDASSPHAQKHIDAVYEILDQIDAEAIDQILVFNKIDLLSEEELIILKKRNPHAQFVSTRTREGLEEFLRHVSIKASAACSELDCLIPFDQGKLISIAHERGRVLRENFTSEGCELLFQCPHALVNLYAGYIREH